MDAIEFLKQKITIAFGPEYSPVIEKPRDPSWGDLSTSISFTIAKVEKRSPKDIADEIKKITSSNQEYFDSVTVAGNGFVNFKYSLPYLQNQLAFLLQKHENYGSSDEGNHQKVQVEFVSANPTGPLNIVSARAAAVGDALVRLLKFRGYDAKSEFYINDSGNQVKLLGDSILARVKELQGQSFQIPDQGYHGKYLIPLAEQALKNIMPIIGALPEEEQAQKLGQWTVDQMVALQKGVLESYHVHFDEWIRESSLYEKGQTEIALKVLDSTNVTYQKDGATFLATSRFGDVEDRVIVTSDGRYTYFLPDIAYHKNKRDRGFQRVIDILGPDHQTFPKRMKAAMTALGYDDKFLDVIILQQVNLIRGGEVVKMSKRSGEMVTMEELLDEVGVDAARFFFCQRRNSSHLDFDIDLALKRTEDNPVYYVQYAHARIASIFRKSPYSLEGEIPFNLLEKSEEKDLIKKLMEFPTIISVCVNTLEINPLTTYLQEVAATYHRFYHEHRVISDDANLSKMRLALCHAAQIVLKNGLNLLGITAPESM
jgi:arginyl-tRNA synthetase